MAPELAERAFDLFTQAERSSDRSLGGLGLGLALVKSIVELHGGTVTCISPGRHEGSTFTVCLPCVARAAPAATQRAPETVAAPGAPLRIMVVDDNVDAGTILQMLLQSAGHEVSFEHCPHRALARAALDPPQVFLLDIGLPDIDGNELARRLRTRTDTAGAVLIAVTGYGQAQDRAQTAAAGFDHHLVKPVDIDTLFSILKGKATSTAA
jgi:CheY-like chemotaxis protein